MPKQQVTREYRLSITSKFIEGVQRWKTLFLLETTRQFASFRYDLAVRERIQGDTIRLTVTGLKTPHLSFPTNGPAQFRQEYDNLRGTYEVVIEGLDHKVNTFTVEIEEQSARLVRQPAHPFVELLVTDFPHETG